MATPSLVLPKELPYEFLKKITDDFSDDRKISDSPFGILYKGINPDDGKVIAVKKLQENAPMPPNKAFAQEVQNVMALKHDNIVQLVGFCSETTKRLVQFDKRYIQADITESLICYEYLPNGSLQKNLFGTKGDKVVSSVKPDIDWDTRFTIIKGICHGLRFLHKLDIPIIHMDLKPENILLDANMVPKIADFALSRVFGQEQTRLCTQTVVGSYGYMAPEYLYRGEISAQSDIYSLGLVIIEITTGEQNCPEKDQPSARNFIDKVREKWTKEEHIASKYPSLEYGCLQQVLACINIGLKCVAIDRKLRPSIVDIVDMLNGLGSR
ncbi:cysteine-rich receptor-like protein kinase 6 [Triticum urartu]|uniref:Protein kinase domain-containing protein n=1 Tax=Triticum urartu TaxID=4572 RepID=A0A8R7VC83_TRIUA|nr:cysteine-rich receptor-like protein kinase 6 [Triticum dicoccoides]XP_037459858.1 cysteine-rich receptor-like protein kinase 6 [Triticum dicoccoides]XP_048546820.1 cysteine-rich receptor-like protein kinase 6 [Triticum urartu]XP_048546821.1 cysteine-rich receptor-like protein kinase 6 [Triticum urartu]XP_048550332.1 cysteine-rich receptor-like protein kinase 6 [Triticum urartu]XP_048550333.1 cysteine-rich receptor-like protein kinase 6 [Triticum urartu]